MKTPELPGPSLHCGLKLSSVALFFWVYMEMGSLVVKTSESPPPRLRWAWLQSLAGPITLHVVLGESWLGDAPGPCPCPLVLSGTPEALHRPVKGPPWRRASLNQQELGAVGKHTGRLILG